MKGLFARAGLVNHPRRDLLACTALAQEQDTRRRLRHARQRVDDRAHRRRTEGEPG
jgi:hypothetical protein